MSQLKDGLAKAWAEHLTAAAGFPFFPARHDGATAPPFGVVVVKRLRPLITADDAHYAELRIVVVSDTAETASAQQRQRAGRAYQAIRETPRQGRDEENGVQLCGFVLEEMEQASGTGDDGRKVFSDVFMITAGVEALEVEA